MFNTESGSYKNVEQLFPLIFSHVDILKIFSYRCINLQISHGDLACTEVFHSVCKFLLTSIRKTFNDIK